MPQIRQEITFAAAPAKLYEALMDSATHTKFTGAPAEIGRDAGDSWSAYGGKIHGRQVELVKDRRIVQTWRAGSWPEGKHSLVRFELAAEGNGTKVVLEHDAVSDDQVQHIEGGWNRMYWEPLRKYLES
jgi:uncharacterized protein YndB with AHSA1/START domain